MFICNFIPTDNNMDKTTFKISATTTICFGNATNWWHIFGISFMKNDFSHFYTLNSRFLCKMES